MAEQLGEHKARVTTLVDEVLNGGDLDRLDELCTPDHAAELREWVAPFRESFPDVRMDVVELVAEGDTVVGRFTCSATQSQPWLGHPPTGRRFERVDEVVFYRFREGRIAATWTLEDNLARLTQLGLTDRADRTIRD